ncbi:pyridoxamine 5'-phosphate oxidase family protein [Maridesulfovibrio hydrothermalis]|uniref:Putative Pyridoxamine 5'-phosphate oxidase-related FMN-binding protein n=1 Tax=Maridesulfovibrio hydrothermalis AM13 = DSM 14728 TaxID=1121451 RepID=L0REY9_9BACT|nr:pyridoxamine 5'-phosphate oxidase family protein [Maridesulfovibrio hydrothermalis]CCO25348.1 putative Pyridoxamine 5'-phosphate oxidase-related FMN-binding protein [Maridesulfovibrio hydrothermalis AM13 = DSM 14728]
MAGENKARKGQTKDKTIIDQYLSEGEILHLALKDRIGIFSVPVNYGFYGDKLYVHSSKQGRKIQALREGGVIGFSIVVSHEVVGKDAPCKWGCSFKSIIGTGVPRILDDKEKAAALNLIMKQYSGKEWEFNPAAIDAVDVVEIMITSVSARSVEKE